MSTGLLDVVDLGSGVIALVLNRPEKRNAFSVGLLGELVAALERLSTDDRCRVIVLAARGRIFSAGADVADPRVNPVGEPGSSEALLTACMDLMASVPQPVVARVHGDVYGGGVGLVAAADIVVAQSDISFVFSEARLGFAPTLAVSTVVPRIGRSAALRMILLGERMSGQAARELGLATFCAEPEELDTELARILAELLQASPSGLASCKALVRDMSDDRRRRTTEDLYALTRELIVSRDAVEGAAAAAAKRQPDWWASPPAGETITSLLTMAGQSRTSSAPPTE